MAATVWASSSAATSGAWLTRESAEVASQSSIHPSAALAGQDELRLTGGRSISMTKNTRLLVKKKP